jgi:hypothetical protein
MSRTERLVAVVLGILLFAGVFTVIYTSLFRSAPADTAAFDEFDDDEFDFAVGQDTGPLSGLFEEPVEAAPARRPPTPKPAASKPGPGGKTER